MGLLNRVADFLWSSEKRALSSALLPPTRNVNEQFVAAGEAVTLPAIYRAVSTIAISAKQMPIDTVRDDKVITSPDFIRQPHIGSSRSTFIEQTVISLATQGNAYWEIVRDPNGKLLELVPLNPLDMRIETEAVTRKVVKYQYLGVDYAPEKIKHLKLLELPGRVYGLGPIQSAQEDIRGFLDLRDYASQWFQKSGVPTGYLKSDQFLNDDQVAATKEAWNSTAGAKNGVAVMGNGFSYIPVYLKPEELQFLQVQQFSVQQIARLFGVPATLMLTQVEGSSMTYTNVSQEWLAFVRFSLMQYLIIIEDALSDFLVGRARAKFNLEAILRADTTTRYAAHASALTAGWMTKNEVRAVEDLPPLPEMETPVTPPAPETPVANNEGDTNV